MYYAALLLGLRPLPGLLNEPLLSLMPGFVFGFLIDNLQHAGKVLEEAGLIVAMVLALGVLGAVSAMANLRWTSSWLPFVFAGAGWLLVCTVLLPVGGAGMLGLNDGPATPPTWDGQAWRLHVSGMVDKPMTLSLGDLRALSPTEEYVTFACVSNNVGGDLMSTGQFTGVRLRDLVAGASPQGGASWVGFRARDGYT